MLGYVVPMLAPMSNTGYATNLIEASSQKLKSFSAVALFSWDKT
jgi:hypothetical protein